MNVLSAITQKKGVVHLRIHVTTNAINTVFPAGYNTWRNSIEVRVQAEPNDNKANTAILEVIAAYFHIPCSSVMIVSGEKTRNKIIALKNISYTTIEKKLQDGSYGL